MMPSLMNGCVCRNPSHLAYAALLRHRCPGDQVIDLPQHDNGCPHRREEMAHAADRKVAYHDRARGGHSMLIMLLVSVYFRSRGRAAGFGGLGAVFWVIFLATRACLGKSPPISRQNLKGIFH
jgi:hypothetical protein